MKRMLFGSVLAAVCSAAAVDYSFIGATDKNPLEYALNETMTFTVTLVDKSANNAAVTGMPLRWTLNDDTGASKSGNATSDQPLVVTHSMTAPGFTRLKVEVQVGGAWLSGNTEFFDGGAGADVMNISQTALPANFASFWQTETNRLYTTPYTVVCTNFNPSGAASGVVYKLFDITTFEGEKHATGILAMPEAADPKECGIIATFNGYGWGATGLPNATDVKKGNIIIAVTRHGEDPVNDDPTYYDPTLKNEMGLDKSGAQKSYCWRNNNYTVQDTDFYKMLMRDLRALQWAKSLPEWNGTTVKVSGGSMGGYQAIGCASLDAAVTECNASIPWCSDLSGGKEYGYMTGWRPDWTANLDFVDLKNLATLMKCPVTFSAGLGDYVCPPSGEINLYKNLPTPKKATFTQNMGHGSTHGPSCSSYTLQDGSFDPPTPPPQPVVGRNLKWSWVEGNSNKKWSNPQNWKDTVGNTNAVPRSGDTLSLTAAGNPSVNDIEGLELKRFNIGTDGAYQYQDQSNCKAITLRADSEGLYNTGYLYLDIPLIIEGTNMTISSTSTLVPRRGWRSYDDKPCGIVKIGSGNAGFSNINGGTAECAGFKYVEVQEGNWAYGLNGQKHMHYLPAGQVFTFGAKNTSLWIGAPCVFTNFWLRETGTAVGKPHTIGNQNDNGKILRGKLTICGTPPDDSTVFTGTFVTCADFCWNPDSATKEFVVAGGNNTTTGDLEVANGTVRLTNDSTYSKLGTLRLSGGANTRLQLDMVPSVAFRGKELTLATGLEKISAPAGTRLTFDRGTVGGSRLLAGVYGAGGQAADWIVGGGSVEILLDVEPTTLTWVGGHSDNAWNDPQNWTNPDGASDVPYACDQIVIVSSAGAIKVPAGTTLNCKTAYVGSQRLVRGTYGAGGTAVDWIVGGGSVVVAENIAATLTWTGNAGNKLWSDANNWKNTTTGQPDAPQDGDTLTLAPNGDTQKNDIVDLKPYRINAANAYANPGGNALIFEEGSWGIYNPGFMYYMIPTIVRAKKLRVEGTSSAGYTTGFYNDEGNEFEIDKAGGGLFAFKTGAGGSPNTFTGLKRINVLAGTLSFGWQGTGQMQHFPAGMEVNFAASDTKLQFDQDTSFTDFCLIETGTAVGGSHSMGVQDTGRGAKTFTITGSPAVNPMVFTGDILDLLSFTWAPDAAANEFVFSGTTAKISTTKTITVTRGTMRLTAGATFKALGTLALTDGGVFAIDTNPDAFSVAQLTLASGNERLRLASGVVMSVAAATVNDQALATGVYDGRGVCGTKVDWIEGGGCLSVGGAPVVYPEEATTDVPLSWTANGGSNTSIGNGSNWGDAGSTALPDFAAGSLVATFGAGTGADLDRRALFKGLNLAAPGAFAFTASGSAGPALLGSSGLVTAGSGRTYDWAWPVYLMADQAWTVGAGDVLNVNGDIGAISSEQLTFNGAGTMNFNVPLGFDGQVNLLSGTVNLNADDALGASATKPLAMDMSASKIYFNGVTLNRTIRNTASTAGNSALYVKANTTNVLNGDLDVTPAVEGRINWGQDSTLRIKGHVKRATTAWFNFNGSGDANHRATLHLDSNTEIVNGSAFSTGSGMNLYFNAPSNQLGGVWFWFTGSYSTLYTTVPYAFAKTAGGQRSVMKCSNANSEWNLCGCDQELAQFGAASPFRVTSDKPALVHLATDTIYYPGDYCVTNTAVFKGGAGLSFDGTKYLHFGGVCDSTGMVQVTKGELRLLPAARWENASAAVVKGGRLVLEDSANLGTNTVLRLSSAGKLDLAEGVKLRVLNPIELDGEPVSRWGTYGSTDSDAKYQDDTYFAGKGVVFCGNVFGTVLFFR